MKRISKEILFTSIPIISVLLLGVAYLNISNDSNYEYLDQDDQAFSEVVDPMTCTYRGKLKLDAITQNSLKRYQRVLTNN